MLRAYPALKMLSLTFSTFIQHGTASMYNVAPKSDKYKKKKKTTLKVRCLHMLQNIVNSDTKQFFFKCQVLFWVHSIRKFGLLSCASDTIEVQSMEPMFTLSTKANNKIFKYIVDCCCLF